MTLNSLVKLLQYCNYSAEVRQNDIFVASEDINEVFSFENNTIQSPTSNVDTLIDLVFNCAVEYEKHNEFLHFCISFLNRGAIYNSNVSLLELIDKVESCIASSGSRNKESFINYLNVLFEIDENDE